jgi:hypothetical protein
VPREVPREDRPWSETDWLDDDHRDERDRSSARPRLLLVLAVVPWLLLAAVVLTGRVPSSDSAMVSEQATGSDEPPADSGGEPSASPDADGSPAARSDRPHDAPEDNGGDGPAPLDADDRAADQAAPSDSAGPDPDASPPAPGTGQPLLVEHRGRWRLEPGAEEAAALAVVVARSWLTDHDPQLDVSGVERPDNAGALRYAEHLVVEAVEFTATDLAVVTVLAVVLDGDDELDTAVRRLAVPIAMDADVRPAGTPWWLPGPTLTSLTPDTEPIEDAAELLGAAEALQTAGYQDVAVDRLDALGPTAALVTVTARTPDGEAVDGTVWLRRHVDRFVVAGMPVHPHRSGQRGPSSGDEGAAGGAAGDVTASDETSDAAADAASDEAADAASDEAADAASDEVGP